MSFLTRRDVKRIAVSINMSDKRIVFRPFTIQLSKVLMIVYHMRIPPFMTAHISALHKRNAELRIRILLPSSGGRIGRPQSIFFDRIL